uniref:Uncharacterized protein n=1 Tax=Rhizophora mucronata TaxID=61149 RepID=A0A2P2PJM5_RHIMU
MRNIPKHQRQIMNINCW